MIVLNGGCDKCGRLVNFVNSVIQSKAFDPVTGEIPILVCNDCYNRYYSLETQRDKKLNKVLRRGLGERIMKWLR